MVLKDYGIVFMPIATKGSTGIQLTKENSKVAFQEKVAKQETNDEFEVPDTFVSLSRSKQA